MHICFIRVMTAAWQERLAGPMISGSGWRPPYHKLSPICLSPSYQSFNRSNTGMQMMINMEYVQIFTGIEIKQVPSV